MKREAVYLVIGDFWFKDNLVIRADTKLNLYYGTRFARILTTFIYQKKDVKFIGYL